MRPQPCSAPAFTSMETVQRFPCAFLLMQIGPQRKSLPFLLQTFSQWASIRYTGSRLSFHMHLRLGNHEGPFSIQPALPTATQQWELLWVRPWALGESIGKPKHSKHDKNTSLFVSER